MKEMVLSDRDILDDYKFWNRAYILSNIYNYATLNHISSVLNESKTSSSLRALIKFFIEKGWIGVFVKDPEDPLKFKEIAKVDSSKIKKNEEKYYQINNFKIAWFLIEGEIGKKIKGNFQARMTGIKMGYLGY